MDTHLDIYDLYRQQMFLKNNKAHIFVLNLQQKCLNCKDIIGHTYLISHPHNT